MSRNVTLTGDIGKSHISIGRFTYGFETLRVLQWNEGAALRIGSFCSIAEGATIFLGGEHRSDWITTFPFGHMFQDELGNVGLEGHPATKGDVVIGDDVWIGGQATILSGISIGCGAIVAANSTVTRDVSPYEIVGGNPAKLIRRRFEPEIISLLIELSWWNLPIESIRELAPTLCSNPDTEILRSLIEKYRAQSTLA